MPRYVALNHHKKALKGSKVLLIGLAYKFFELYEEMEAEVSYYDTYIPKIRPTREYPLYEGLESVKWSKDVIQSFYVVVISTSHKKY